MKGVILDRDSLGDVDLAPLLECLDDCIVHDFTETADVPARIAGADVVLSNKVPLTKATIAGSDSLKLISVMATGTNNIDLAAATRLNIPVCNAVAYATPSVVQHTMSLMLALTNNLVHYIWDVRNHRWQASKVFCRLDYPIQELAGKTLGIVGYGELGRGVADVARAFGMHVIAARREGQAANDSVQRLAFNDLLAEADYLSLHCPLTPDTENLINEDTLAKMKPGAFLINTARGGLVQPEHLIDALKTGVIAGAAVDVVPIEPPDKNDVLTNAALPNLLVTPHNAWGAIESRQRLIKQMRENIEAFRANAPIRVVN